MMRALCLLLILLPFSVSATTPDELRELMRSGDFETAESVLEAVREAARPREAGAKALIDQRRLYDVFSTTDPRVLDTIERWETARPTSVHSRTVQGLAMLHASWLMRGKLLSRETYPLASEKMGRMRNEAARLAWAVYREDGEFIPASDLALSLRLLGFGHESVEAITADVMANRPNLRTLLKAVQILSPRWGGSVERVFSICDRYAPQISADESARITKSPYDSDFCKVSAIYEHHIDGLQRTWAQGYLDENPDVDFVSPRLFDAIYDRVRGPEHKDWIIGLYRRAHGLKIREANYIETFYAAEDFAWNQRDDLIQRTLDRLETDPFNADQILNLNQIFQIFQKPKPGMTAVEIEETLAKSRRQNEKWDMDFPALFERALKTSPYNAEVWMLLARWEPDAHAPPGFARAVAHAEKAVIYSNHSPRVLQFYFDTAHMPYSNFRRFHEKGWTEWQGTPFDPSDLLSQLECPVYRSAKIFHYICDEIGGPKICNMRNGTNKNMRELVKDEIDGPLCPKLRNAPIEELVFYDNLEAARN